MKLGAMIGRARPEAPPGAARRRRRRTMGLGATVLSAAMTAGLVGVVGVGQAAAAHKHHKALSGVVKVGASVSLSGDFSGTGKTTKEGYEVWQKWQNEHGGILGHKVQMVFLSDGSSPTQVVTNYQKLITVDHVTFVLGPYSTLLTKPSSVIANRYGYTMLEGIGGGPSVFETGLKNVFDVSASARFLMITFAHWVAKALKPQKVAFASLTTPFSEPQVAQVRTYLKKKGFTVTTIDVYPLETSDFTPIASKIAASGAKIVVTGNQPPDAYALIQDYAQEKYNPSVLIEGSGPDQGDAFVKAIGKTNTTGIMVPNTWYPGMKGFHDKTMMQITEKMFHVKAATVSANVAEAFSAGQVLGQAVNHIKSKSNKKLMDYLHTKHAKFQSVQGPVCFAPDGENVCAVSLVFQWQHGQLKLVLPATKPGAVKIMNPKPAWGQSQY